MRSLPTGTVTFFVTDIEGFTALLKRPIMDASADVLMGYRRLVRTAVEQRGGQEVRTEGDAVLAGFPSAREAMLAAADAQHDILRHPWPDGAVVRVRMGLHTGEARVANGEYVGMDVHRASSICAVAHGGQILLSDATYALVTRDMPDGLSLRDLGEHRLKHFAHPTRLFQVVAPDLPSNFPALRTLDRRFLTETTPQVRSERILTTILFLDVTGSTERAVALGDETWRNILARYHEQASRAFSAFGGVEVGTAGDGILATFDGPASAIRCVRTIQREAAPLGLRLHAGVHTGEVERVGRTVQGVAVHVAARIAALATSNEVLVSATVKDLIAGSGLSFEDRGVYTLKGLPEPRQVFALTGES